MENEKNRLESIIKTIVIVFFLVYGLHYFGYFLRARYYNFIGNLSLSEGVHHVFQYLGHLVYLLVYIIYIWIVKDDRKYFLSAFKESAGKNIIKALSGALLGFCLMGICIFAASAHGDISVGSPSGTDMTLFLFAFIAVFIQASIEEVETRGFVFGKMKDGGVPVKWAIVVSSFFFAYLHATNPGFGFLPLLSIFIVGIQYVLIYHYFGNLWITFAAHAMWNFTQDFIFGLPDSGKPAAVSIFNTTVSSSSFFYDKDFGIEGSMMAILVNAAVCIIVLLIGNYLKKWQKVQA